MSSKRFDCPVIQAGFIYTEAIPTKQSCWMQVKATVNTQKLNTMKPESEPI